MPNHVTNILTIKAPTEVTLSHFLESINGDDVIDFNKIIPMPESLNITSGGYQDEAIIAFLTDNCKEELTPTIRKKIEHYGVKNHYDIDWVTKAYSRTAQTLAKNGPSKLYSFSSGTPRGYEKTLYDAGAIYTSNVDKYGHATWYSWCIDNWGTKWGAYDCSLSKDSKTSATLCFNTAWAAPNYVIDKLAQQNPRLAIHHEWADEDIGYNCGYVEYENGERVAEDDFELSSDPKEAFNFACEVLGFEPSEFDE